MLVFGGSMRKLGGSRLGGSTRTLAGVALAAALLACGCGSKEDSSASAGPTTGAPAKSGAPAGGVAGGFGKAGGAPAGGTAAPAGDSFFAGPVPAGVTLKATKAFAIGPGILTFQGVEGWSGGKLPGWEYMAMTKDSQAMFRVATSTGVTAQMGCPEISSAAGMLPLKAKNLKESSTPVMRKVGKNGFVAREGTCSGDGPKGPVEIHFIDLARKDKDGVWHYAVIAGFPTNATPELRNEVMAWARSLEYSGESAYTMP